jgi:branched-chain amino acid aminotransferase
VLSPQAKLAASYLYTSMAKAAARADGFDDVLLLDQDGCIAESSTLSFFWVESGEVFTAPTEVVLAGVTRRVVIELAQDEGLPVHEVQRPLAALDRAQECFLTGTSLRVWPVARVGERGIPAPVPGVYTGRIARRLNQLLAGEDPKLSPRWLQPL